jgi:hypothetical protein
MFEEIIVKFSFQILHEIMFLNICLSANILNIYLFLKTKKILEIKNTKKMCLFKDRKNQLNLKYKCGSQMDFVTVLIFLSSFKYSLFNEAHESIKNSFSSF